MTYETKKYGGGWKGFFETMGCMPRYHPMLEGHLMPSPTHILHACLLHHIHELLYYWSRDGYLA